MAAQISPSPPTMPHVGPCEYGQFLRSQLVHSTCHTSSLPSIVAEGVVQARHLRSYAPAVRTRSTVAPASSELPWLPSVPQTPPARSAPSMDLSVAATDQRDRPLPVAGFKGTPEEIEQQWYEQVYRGRGDSMAQLTWRAVLIGSCLGAVLSLTNLYIGDRKSTRLNSSHANISYAVFCLKKKQ